MQVTKGVQNIFKEPLDLCDDIAYSNLAARENLRLLGGRELYRTSEGERISEGFKLFKMNETDNF